MSPSVRLPLELLAHIVSYLGDNRDALRNLCLSSAALHAVSYPILFSVRDFRALGAPYLEPFLLCLTELRISWKPDMHGGNDAKVLARRLAPYLSAETAPRLQKLTIRGIGADGMFFLNTLGGTFKGFASLTSLHLNETYHADMRSVQQLLSALPRLAHLHVNAITWISPDFNDCGDDCEFLERPVLKTLRVSPVYPNCMLPLLAWLARTPTAQTLDTLEVPLQARIGPDALPHFGASVRHLTVPLQGLRPLISLKGYTALTSLTLFVRIDDLLTGSYVRLPEVLATLPAPALLRTLEIHIPREAAFMLPGTLDALARVDDVLFGAGPTGTIVKLDPDADCSEVQRFDALAQLRVVLLSTSAPEEKERAETDWAAQLHMPHAGAQGRLEVRFGRDESMAHAFSCGPGRGMALALRR